MPKGSAVSAQWTAPLPQAQVQRTPPLLPRSANQSGDGQTPQLSWMVQLPTGRSWPVTGNGLIGRHPSAEDPTVQLIELPDPAAQLSRNHLAFGLNDAGVLWVKDLGSRNGSHLVDGRLQIALPPQQRYPLASGAVVRLGEHALVFTARPL
ncbi:MAG: FHA domain-containing protein [Bifidobacteriaceae bacterium]|jgi:hypothetical protein|nr:FHA domain-containing protein [Bifidobacteriaceae bacterium]